MLSESKLPPEICDHIIDYLWNDRRALAACNLVCRAWLPATRTHIFNRIRLPNKVTSARFRQLLAESPYIARHVRALSIRRSSRSAGLPLDYSEILQKLTSLRHLYVRCMAHTSDPYPAFVMETTLEPSLHSSFAMLETLHLRHLVFVGPDLPVLLCSCPRLSVLQMVDVRWMHDYDNDASFSIAPAQNIQIAELVLNEVTSNIIRFLGNGTLQLWLRRLETSISVEDLSMLLSRVHQDAERTLQHLIVSATKNSRSRDGTMLRDIPQLRDLRKLHLKKNIPRSRAEDASSWLTTILVAVEAIPLHFVQIDLELYGSADLVFFLDWHLVDAALAGLSRQGALVVLCIEEDNTTDDSRELMVVYLSNYLIASRTECRPIKVVLKDASAVEPKRIIYLDTLC
ncbi:uncharacterized protein LAESUDRAFT_713654 [Laetiporus sulphureus 93-53]|uniref:F-box domain-containing protein n=1 Tax=Laetiporus sulphureus 93-53 TaxID=1314785 RepID=A0A165EIX1_9APHY|nr:uncharacterized protein LAESUDRAFT_713654 [Laetiporus sulphureus 93-53]KZT07144.1 hypothetical protein LAESUDRAFT_713654 [Laetiporus sulphureus 93-53]